MSSRKNRVCNGDMIVLSWSSMTEDIFEGICRSILEWKSRTPLRVVDLNDNQLGPANTQKIASCLQTSAVKEILFRYNDIGKDGCDGLAGVLSVSMHVKHLDVRGNGLSALDVRKLLKNVSFSTSLTRLGLGNNKLGPEGAALVAQSLECNTYVTSLDLSMNEMGAEGAGSIAKLFANPASALSDVQLYGNRFGPDGVQSICESLKRNTQLRRLSLGNNHATDAAATHLADMLEHNASLEELDVRSNTLTALSMKEIAHRGLAQNSTLTSLILCGNPIGAAGAEELSKYCVMNQRSALTDLDVSACGLGSTGGMRMANMIGSSSVLRSINLSDNQLDDEAAEALARYMRGSYSLLSVNLSSNEIGESGASSLIETLQVNSKLTSLLLHGNNINRVAQRKIDNVIEGRLVRNRKAITTVDSAGPGAINASNPLALSV